jgi:hypothetical protein
MKKLKTLGFSLEADPGADTTYLEQAGNENRLAEYHNGEFQLCFAILKAYVIDDDDPEYYGEYSNLITEVENDSPREHLTQICRDLFPGLLDDLQKDFVDTTILDMGIFLPLVDPFRLKEDVYHTCLFKQLEPSQWREMIEGIHVFLTAYRTVFYRAITNREILQSLFAINPLVNEVGYTLVHAKDFRAILAYHYHELG